MNFTVASVGMALRGADVRAGELYRRIVSAFVLAPVVLAAVLAGFAWFGLLVAVGGAVLAWEWSRLCNAGRFGGPGWILAVSTVATIVLAAATHAFGWALATCLAAALVTYVGARTADSPNPAWMAAGVLCVAVPCIALLWLRALPTSGRDAVLWLLLVTWAADIGAYAAGRTIGGPRLAPRISPNKTWAGLAGGLAAAALVGGACIAGFDPRMAFAAAAAACLIGLAVVVGDLLESATKRRFHVKDSSGLIPGHGGLFDRVDGLLLAAPTASLMILAGWRWL